MVADRHHFCDGWPAYALSSRPPDIQRVDFLGADVAGKDRGAVGGDADLGIEVRACRTGPHSAPAPVPTRWQHRSPSGMQNPAADLIQHPHAEGASASRRRRKQRFLMGSDIPCMGNARISKAKRTIDRYADLLRSENVDLTTERLRENSWAAYRAQITHKTKGGEGETLHRPTLSDLNL
jgi:hypothetical protein